MTPPTPPPKAGGRQFLSLCGTLSCPGLLCLLSTFSPAWSHAFSHSSQQLAYHLRCSKCSIVKLAGAEYVRTTPLEDVKPHKKRVSWANPRDRDNGKSGPTLNFFLPLSPLTLLPALWSLCSWPGLTFTNYYTGATAWRVLCLVLEGRKEGLRVFWVLRLLLQ